MRARTFGCVDPEAIVTRQTASSVDLLHVKFAWLQRHMTEGTPTGYEPEQSYQVRVPAVALSIAACEDLSHVISGGAAPTSGIVIACAHRKFQAALTDPYLDPDTILPDLINEQHYTRPDGT